MRRYMPPYPAEFRQQIVQLARDGQTPAELARQFGCSPQAVAKWLAAEGGNPLPRHQGLSDAEREELVQLRREVTRLQQERDILAKATAWFAGRSEKTSTPSTNS
jgi:transposase